MEILISMGYKVICIYLIAANPVAVIAFDIILNGTATFNHSNINVPLKTDKYLRWILITPDIHRIHHSTVQSETDNNYGFSISQEAEPEKNSNYPGYWFARIPETGRTGLS